jgi:hypothetical protein
MEAELRFFDCGDGDTILIRGGNEWALVDANLTRKTRKRLEETLLENRVEHLRFVCVTHFDTDHIRGLGQFLTDHFRRKDTRGNVRWEIEQIILPLGERELMPLLYASAENLSRYIGKNGGATRAVIELIEMLNDISHSLPAKSFSKVMSYSPTERLTSPDQQPKPVALGPWDVWFLGPRKKTLTEYWIKFSSNWNLQHWEKLDRPKSLQGAIGANDISQIIGLCHHNGFKTVLLTGDATQQELEESLKILELIRKEAKRPPQLPFLLVKSSHHGAYTDCHYVNLYQTTCKQRRSNVVISCLGNYGHHPHEKVLTDIIDLGLKSYLTGSEFSGTQGSRKKSYLPGLPTLSPAASSPDIAVVVANDACVINGGRDGAIYLDLLRKYRAQKWLV